jgi:hypothetical protein
MRMNAVGTWATVVMGGSVASHNNFWQLFIRPAGSQRWKLVTPPGVADNGGLVLAVAGPSLITGFRPSQGLTFTPLTQTRDGGQAWSSTGPLTAPLANVPDALAAAPGGGNLLALQTDGTASIAAPGYTRWATLASPRSLAAAPDGQRCGLRSITAVAYTPAGQPLLGGTCSRPGTAGIFTDTGGTWQAAGPVLPPPLGSEPITVMRLTTTNGQIVTLLTAGSRADRQPARRLVRRQRPALDSVADPPPRRRRPDVCRIRARRDSCCDHHERRSGSDR